MFLCRRYVAPEGQTTVWGDIQRKLGNFAPLPERYVPPAFTPEPEGEKGKERLEKLGEEDLENAEDDGDLADDEFLAEYRSVLSLCLSASLFMCLSE